ncbi:hypothetical protein NC652_035094 [Populus alba x Populus x berolinensis]|nr:hypothetical protein NC652_035094 [Populus alba x Populus x berolinensis]
MGAKRATNMNNHLLIANIPLATAHVSWTQGALPIGVVDSSLRFILGAGIRGCSYISRAVNQNEPSFIAEFVLGPIVLRLSAFSELYTSIIFT